MLGAENRKPERGHDACDDDGAAQRLPLFGKARHEWQEREPRHRRDRRDDPDPERVDPDRLQPHREKRQMGPHHAKHRAVEQRQPCRESPGGLLRSDGDC